MTAAHHKFIWPTAGLLGLDGLLFGSTDAGSVPSFIVIVGFLALAATLCTAWYALFSLFSLYGITLRQKGRLAVYAGGLTSCLAALQSIGELSRRDVVVLLPLVILSYLYTVYARASKHNYER